MSLKNLLQQYTSLEKNLEKSVVKLPKLRPCGITVQKSHYPDHEEVFKAIVHFKPIEGYVLQQSGKQVFVEGENLINNFESQGLILFAELINEQDSLLLRQQQGGFSLWLYQHDYAKDIYLYDVVDLVTGTLGNPYNKMQYRRYWRQADNSRSIEPFLFVFQGFNFEKTHKGASQ